MRLGAVRVAVLTGQTYGSREGAAGKWRDLGISWLLPSIRRYNVPIAELDDTNRRLLAELQQDARLSLAELGRRVGLSSPAVAERLQRLERDQVIRGYRAELDPVALGYPLTAIIRIRPAPRQLAKVAELTRAAPEVVECLRITGEDCYLMKAHVRSVTHLEELIDQFTPFGQTTTSIVQSAPVPERGVAV